MRCDFCFRYRNHIELSSRASAAFKYESSDRFLEENKWARHSLIEQMIPLENDIMICYTTFKLPPMHGFPWRTWKHGGDSPILHYYHVSEYEDYYNYLKSAGQDFCRNVRAFNRNSTIKIMLAGDPYEED